MVGSMSYVGIAIMISGGVVAPIALAIWWIKFKNEKLTSILVGALTWFLFAIVLEAIPRALFFNSITPVGKAVLGNAALFTTVGGLMAGIFEETGRLVAFKTLLRKRTNRETSVSHGIGHGGFEAMFILGLSGIQYLIYARMISEGTFSKMVEEISATGADVSSLESLPKQIASITPLTAAYGFSERVFAIILHIALSMLVFYAVREKKMKFYLLAIVIHAIFDVPAALYQYGELNVYVAEILIAVGSIAAFIVIYKKFYLKMRAADEPEIVLAKE